tara:strand:+ start:150 stop:407 length:258 start_codon:yes stop_codon:yes gene_type:complete
MSDVAKNIPVDDSALAVNDPALHWQGMLDFEQDKQAPYAMFNLRVRSAEDLEKLEVLIGQRLTVKTKSAWFPKLEKNDNGMKRWR